MDCRVNTLFILVLNFFIRRIWKVLLHQKIIIQRILLVTTRARIERVLKQLSTYEYGHVSAICIVDDRILEYSNVEVVQLDNLVTYATEAAHEKTT